MTETTQPAIRYAHENRQRFMGELDELLRIPSVSTLPEHAVDVRRAAEWVAAKLRKIGISEAQVFETGCPNSAGLWAL
jgi:acetylornithine deacetylase/succinyl-diaminopimelate desuccinylase-like protein